MVEWKGRETKKHQRLSNLLTSTIVYVHDLFEINQIKFGKVRFWKEGNAPVLISNSQKAVTIGSLKITVMLVSKLVLLVFFSHLKCSTTHVFLFTFTFHLFIVCLLVIFVLCWSSFNLFTLICFFLITFKFLFAACSFVFFVYFAQ